MPERDGLASMEDANESQNVIHFVRSPLNFFIDNFGSFTWGVIVRAGAGAGGITMGSTGGVGVGQMGVTYGCETTLGIGEGSTSWTCVPAVETDNGVVLQAEVLGLNLKPEYGYKYGAGMA